MGANSSFTEDACTEKMRREREKKGSVFQEFVELFVTQGLYRKVSQLISLLVYLVEIPPTPSH